MHWKASSQPTGSNASVGRRAIPVADDVIGTVDAASEPDAGAVSDSAATRLGRDENYARPRCGGQCTTPPPSKPMTDIILEFLIEVFLWGTGALLVRVITLNKCNPYTLNEDLVTLIGILFWVTIIVLIAILY